MRINIKIESGLLDGTVLPIRIVDSQGTILEEGSALADGDSTFDVEHGDGPLFVRFILPSGKLETVQLTEAEDASMTLTWKPSGYGEWSAWASSRLQKAAVKLGHGHDELEKYRNTWLKFWCFNSNECSERAASIVGTYRSSNSLQLNLQLSSGAWLLQVGGNSVPWQFISLPSGMLTKVLITISDRSAVSPLRFVVSGLDSDAENMMEYLNRDYVSAASAVANRILSSTKYGEELGVRDGHSVLAAYYVMLRRDERLRATRESLPIAASLCSWSADGHLIDCVSQLREGGMFGREREAAMRSLDAAMHRGLPLFSEGLALAIEALSLLKEQDENSKRRAYLNRLASAKAWAGSFLSFYGVTPSNPSSARFVGSPSSFNYQRKSDRTSAAGSGQSAFDEGAYSEVFLEGAVRPSLASITNGRKQSIFSSAGTVLLRDFIDFAVRE